MGRYLGVWVGRWEDIGGRVRGLVGVLVLRGARSVSTSYRSIAEIEERMLTLG